MKQVRIAFVDFWNGFDKDNFILTKALREKYDVVILNTASEADYVFFSLFGDEHWFLPDHCIKIFYAGENICPDFNACDYAVGFEWLDYGDRYLRLPNYYCTPLFADGTKLMEKHNIPSDPEKRGFCSFVVSNADANPIRQQFFEELSKYKKVDSGGRFLNNVGGPIADKIEFHRQHKFVIAFENSSHPGYTTEKIVDAFAAGCVPIYWGDPEVCRVFNSKAFVQVNSVEHAVEYVKRLDQDDDSYLEMLAQPPLLYESDTYNNRYREAVAFMCNIVDQPHDMASRFNREFWGRKYQDRERLLVDYSRKTTKELIKNKIKQLF